MGMIDEFKEFALKGNVVDLAVGVIIGAAFGKVVSALVEGVLMPPISFLMSGVDVKDWGANLGTVAKAGSDQVRRIPAVDYRLRDHRVRAVLSHQGDEQDEEATGNRGAAGTARVGSLPQGNSRRAGKEVTWQPRSPPAPHL